MYRIVFTGYCGMVLEDETVETREEARLAASEIIRDRRKDGLPVTTLEPGEVWEVLEPEDNCALVPDECGILQISHITFACRRCGYQHELVTDRAYCCSEEQRWDLMSEEERQELREEHYAS